MQKILKIQAIKNALPSKKFAFVGTVIFVLLFGIFLSSRAGGISALFVKKQKRGAETAHTADAITRTPAKIQDTDGDGLADWEEVLWKTDPMNADTDNDGVPDNLMVENLKLQQEKTEKQTAVQNNDAQAQAALKSAPLPETLTDEIAQRLITDYLQLKNGKGTLSPNDTAAIAQNALKSVTDQRLVDFYTSKQLTYAADDTGEQLRYVNEVGAALKTHFGEFDANELDLFFSENREPGAGVFDPYIAAYTGAEKQLLAVVVPPSFLKPHLDLLNSFHNTAIAVEAMQASEHDPARGMLGAGWYMQEVDRSRDFLKNMYAAIQKNRLVVSSQEPGFMFVEYGIQL